jgi:hypothetical protein
MKRVLLPLIVLLLSLVPAVAQQLPTQPPPPPTGGVPDFKVTARPDAVSVHRGSVTQVTVSVEPLSGFKGRVDLLCSLLYATTMTFQPAAVDDGAGTSTLTIAPSASAIKGSYVMSITAVGGGISHMITVRVRVR